MRNGRRTAIPLLPGVGLRLGAPFLTQGNSRGYCAFLWSSSAETPYLTPNSFHAPRPPTCRGVFLLALALEEGPS